MAGAAELQQTHFEHQSAEPIFGLAEAVPLLESDKLVRARAGRLIGKCTASENLAVIENEETENIGSLYEGVTRAAEGDPVATKMVRANVTSEAIEISYKAGHVMKVKLDVDSGGRAKQHDQYAEDIQSNSLKLASANKKMRPRTEAEATNAFRIEDLNRQGLLTENSFVVFSLAADNMSEQEMTECGFFTDTMTCVIQVTTASESGLTTESAFVAGVKNPGAERHDLKAVLELVQKLGIDFSGKNAAEIINTPILVNNSLLPNGAIDLVKLYDEYAGSTFFGQDNPKQDYIKYLDKCRQREVTLGPKIDSILAELIGEAPRIDSPINAINRLHKLTEKHMVEQAAFDREINPLVFGATAAHHIEQARIAFELGNNNTGLEQLIYAKNSAKSYSCPSSILNKDSESTPGEDEMESTDQDCEFVSKECPLCGAKNVKTKSESLAGGKKKLSGKCGCVKVYD